jgi:microcystin-dependent protein
MNGDALIGTVSAFAGQLDTFTGGANNIWRGCSCCSQNSRAGIGNNDVPISYVEANGWMFCDGRSLDKNTYPELFSVIGYLYGKNDQMFNLPDYRGMFLRGVDAGSGMDPDAASRIGPAGSGTNSGIGSFQCDALQTHTHSYQAVQLAAPAQAGKAAAQTSSDTSTSAPERPAQVSSETRPKNIAVNYIIKYR